MATSMRAELRLAAAGSARPAVLRRDASAAGKGRRPPASVMAARASIGSSHADGARRVMVAPAARGPVPVLRRSGIVPRESGQARRKLAPAPASVPEEKSEEKGGFDLYKALDDGLGSIVLLSATALSIYLANSAFAATWIGLFNAHVGPAIGGHTLTVQGWINEGLMAIFFFLVGMEIKRECVFGALASIKQSILPCMAALGGMVVPILIYCSLNMGTGGTMSGWAIPMATDIAFAMGIFGFFSKRMPRSASAFLLTLATVDDLGAILVIALFFATKISIPFLSAAAATTAGLFAIPKVVGDNVKTWMYVVGGVALWFFLLTAGVNADVAGVVAAMAIPGSAPAPEKTVAHSFEPGMKVTLLDHLIHNLHPWSALLIMPLFALANTAVPVDISLIGGLASKPVALGIILGLVIGKPIGITAFTLAAIKSGIATMPEGCTTKHLLVLGLLGGVGFTMCLFLIALALASNPAAMNLGKLAVIAASAFAAVVGAAVMSTFPEQEPTDAREPLPNPA